MESEDTSLGTFGPNVTLNCEVCSPDTRGTMEDPQKPGGRGHAVNSALSP